MEKLSNYLSLFTLLVSVSVVILIFLAYRFKMFSQHFIENVSKSTRYITVVPVIGSILGLIIALADINLFTSKVENTPIKKVSLPNSLDSSSSKEDYVPASKIIKKSQISNRDTYIRGRIIEFGSGEPIFGATVSIIDSTAVIAKSDVNGYFEFVMSESHDHKRRIILFVDKHGYERELIQVYPMYMGVLEVFLAKQKLR